MQIGEFRLDQTCKCCPEQYDVFLGERPVGYLRLRHGYFAAYYPDPGGDVVYEADTFGDGGFEPDERDMHLALAVDAIKLKLTPV